MLPTAKAADIKQAASVAGFHATEEVQVALYHQQQQQRMMQRASSGSTKKKLRGRVVDTFIGVALLSSATLGFQIELLPVAFSRMHSYSSSIFLDESPEVALQAHT